MKQNENPVFPRPKKILFQKGSLTVKGVEFDVSCLTPEEGELVTLLGERHFPGPGEISIVWESLEEKNLYEIKIDGTSIHIKCGNEAVSSAFCTLVQLGRKVGKQWSFPCCTIRDFPDYRRRGLYLECHHGTDRMTLKDYQEMLDTAWDLKFNHITIGVYGCWTIRQFPRIEEYYFLPPGKYNIRSRIRLRYYSARKKKHVSLNYSPFAAKPGFLREIVKYAQERGIGISWHFNCLGHNTLLPRLIPQISAKDSRGRPKGLAFCLSDPETLKVLSHILCGLAEETKVKKMHIGMDEVFSLFKVDEEYPMRRVSPRCRCPECQKQPYRKLILSHIIKLLKVLKEAGLEQVSLWHDQITRMGLAEEFENLLKKEGLQDFVLIQCWYYNNFTAGEKPYVFPEISLPKAIVPMTGFGFWGHYPDHTRNIIPLLKNEAGAEAAESYAVYSPTFHYNYACLAESSWNAEKNDPETFFSLYLKHFPMEGRKNFKRALRALLDAEKKGISHLLFAYANASENYPADRLLDLRNKHPELIKTLPEIIRLYKQTMEDLRCPRKKIEKGNFLYGEAARCHFLAEIFHYFLTHLQDIPGGFTASRKEIREMTGLTDKFILTFEQNYPSYLLPQSLRFISMIRDFIIEDIEEK